MKRNAIFLCDIIACIVVIVWSMFGPWDRILGFNFYHSRGDVWLPTPIPAANFFRGMVSTGSMLFGCFFLLTSCLIFFLRRARATDADGKRGIIYGAFYADTSNLICQVRSLLVDLVHLAVFLQLYVAFPPYALRSHRRRTRDFDFIVCHRAGYLWIDHARCASPAPGPGPLNHPQ